MDEQVQCHAAPDALTLPLLPPSCPPPPFQTRAITSPHKGKAEAGDGALVAGEEEKKKSGRDGNQGNVS